MEVMEEHHKVSDYNLTASLLLPDQNIKPRYQLQFINKVQDPTYTTDLVRDEIGVPIRIEIYDSYTQSRVSTDCFLSSAKVQLMVVDAEYWKNRVNWSTSEFVQNVLRPREGKRPILTGRSLIIQLKNGVGSFENIVLNDNSSWTKSGFRLAVMFKGEREEGSFNEERVQEGVSERFRVKDCRGKATKKPDRLELTHNVRCIKKIGKDRASCLEKKNINNVENFLKLYYNDEPKLRKMLGIKSESGKEWESMIEHVMQCADEYKKKCIASNNSSQPRQDCVIVPHQMEENLFLSTNGGCCVVGLGSSKSNQSHIIGGDVSAINRQHVSISKFSLMNLSNQPISAGRMVQYTGERHNAGGDGGNYSGIDGGNYGGGGIAGGTYGGGGGGIGNYGGGGIGIGYYGGSGGIGNYGGGGDSGGIGIGNYGGGRIGIGNYGGGGISIGNYGGGGIGIGNYGGGGGIGIGNYGGGGIGVGNYGGGGGIGIGNYSGGGIGIGNYGDSGDIGNYSGGDDIGIGNYDGGGIGNYGDGGGIGNYGGGGGIGNYGGGGGIGNYGGGGGISNYGGSGGIGISNYGGGGGIGNYGGGGIGIGNYGGGDGIGIGNYGGGGGIGNDVGSGGGSGTYSGDGGGIDGGTYGSSSGGGDIDNYGDAGNGGGSVN